MRMQTELCIERECVYLFMAAKGSDKDITIASRIGYFTFKTLSHDAFYNRLIGWIRFTLEVINEEVLKIRIMFYSKALRCIEGGVLVYVSISINGKRRYRA
jgi:hypothetical protein